MIEFKNPPAARGGRGSRKYDAVADELRQNPGAWAIIVTNARPGTAASIQAGKYLTLPRGEFEVTIRKTDGDGDGRDVYARFVGGDQ